MNGSRKYRASLLWGIGLFWVCAFYLYAQADAGWIAHDDGYLAQSAERMLGGELPHRDFDDVYTGGLALLHALAFQIGGIDLLVLRRTLLLFSLLAVVALYWLALRFVPPPGAALSTLVAVSWGMPNYFASVASWYNLIFALLALCALCRHLDTGRRRWLFVAGLFLGVSLLVKVVALFALAAAILFVLYHETAQSFDPAKKPSKVWLPMVALAVSIYVAGLVLLTARLPEPVQLINFLLPGTLLAGVVLHQEKNLGTGPFLDRARHLSALIFPLLGGFFLPLSVFLIPYALSGSLGDVWRGVFLLPSRRLDFSAASPQPLAHLVAVVPLLLLLLASRRRRFEIPALATLFLLLLALLESTRQANFVDLLMTFFSSDPPRLYDLFWASVRPIVPAMTAVGAGVLAFRHREIDATRRRELFLLLAMAAMLSMVQFPFTSRVYVFYFAPLVPVVLLALHRCLPKPSGRVLAGAGGVFMLFALLFLHPKDALEPLDLERAQLRIDPRQAASYHLVHELVEKHSEPGEAIWASPDSPAVYFLTQRRNPTPTFYDFFDADYAEEGKRQERILRMLDQENIQVVVVRKRPHFSRPLEDELLHEIAKGFPFQDGDRRFTVYWRSIKNP